MIDVRAIDEATFEVKVGGRTPTTHRVTVDPLLYDRLTGARESREELVRRSFEFLLDREPNASILRAFDLSVISRYFPEYERVMSEALSGSGRR